MTQSKTKIIFGKLDGLRTELVDLAFVLECRGRLEAADVAMTISARIGELCEEFTTAGTLPPPDAVERDAAPSETPAPSPEFSLD
jgi:hypothetical protein